MSVFEPKTVDDLIESAMIELGKPVIQINVAPVQATLCAKRAIDKYCDWHYDATEHVYIAHEITEQDMANNYITTPKEVWNVIRVIGSGGYPACCGASVSSYGGQGLYGSRYSGHTQYNNVRSSYGPTDALVSMYLAEQHKSYFNSIIRPNVGMTWNKGSKRIRFEGSISQSAANCGNFVIYEAYVVNENLCFDCNNPEGNGTCFYDNEWLREYTAALIKKQWGQNMSKFKNIPIANGYEFNGAELLSDAKDDIERLEEDLTNKYSMPAYMIIG